jgi:hypothetical protein
MDVIEAVKKTASVAFNSLLLPLALKVSDYSDRVY